MGGDQSLAGLAALEVLAKFMSIRGGHSSALKDHGSCLAGVSPGQGAGAIQRRARLELHP